MRGLRLMRRGIDAKFGREATDLGNGVAMAGSRPGKRHSQRVKSGGRKMARGVAMVYKCGFKPSALFAAMLKEILPD